MTFAAVALAFAFTLPGAGGKPYDGTNGLNPADIWLVAEAGDLVIDEVSSARWRAWLAVDESRREIMKYLVRCALPAGKRVTLGKELSWEGELNLGAETYGRLTGLALDAKGNFVPLPSGGEATRGKAVPFLFGKLEGKWISACLMAFANTALRHEYVSLRGNPGPHAPALTPDPAHKWTYDYPEGVFLADLLSSDPDAHPDPDADLQHSYTLSMNLPAAYEDAAARWRPYNASVGRTLTWKCVTTVRNQTRPGEHAVARRVGTYPSPPPDGTIVCPAVRDRPRVKCGPGRFPSSCMVGDTSYPPIFVYLPVTVKLASAVAKAPPAARIAAISTGDVRLEASQAEDCDASTCTGEFPSMSDADPMPPPPPGEVGPARRLAGLRPGQSVDVVLRAPLKSVDRRQRFTAIVRYSAAADMSTAVEAPDASGNLARRTVVWPGTREIAAAWMQIYPVHVNAKGALLLRIHGGPKAPTLDVAGFVPGRPSCRTDDAPFAGVCD